jgi:protein-tyrosine phosphatase
MSEHRSVSSPRLGDMPPAAFTVLFVCTGNICRSPLAERFGRAMLAGEDGAELVHLHSAGTRAVVGAEMHAFSADALRRLGGEPDGFLARQLQDDMAVSADLTLTMTREHRQAALARAPRALARTFTLIEAVDLLDLLGSDAELPDGTPVDRARALVTRMAGARSTRQSGRADDVPDPIGQPAEVHDHVGDTVAGAVHAVLSRFVDVLVDRLPTGS